MQFSRIAWSVQVLTIQYALNEEVTRFVRFFLSFLPALVN